MKWPDNQEQSKGLAKWAGLLTLSGGLVFTGELLQAERGLREDLANTVGQLPMELYKGHASDLGFVLGMVSMAGLTIEMTNKFIGGTKELKDRATGYLLAAFSFMVSMSEINEEYKAMRGLVDVSKCGQEGYRCRGDWGDVAVFSIPAIAAIGWIVKDQIKQRKK